MPIDQSKTPVVTKTVQGKPQYNKSSNEKQQRYHSNENASEPFYEHMNACEKAQYVNFSDIHPGVSNPRFVNENVYEITEKL